MMQKSKAKSLLCAACCCAGLAVSAGTPGTVNANVLNIRMKPDIQSPVAVKLRKGAKVDVNGVEGEFYRIAAPEGLPVYISAVYILDDKLTAPLTMRVDMAPNAAGYGELPKGTAVKVLELSRHGWAKIAPPENLELYTAKVYVTLDGPLPAAPEKTPETAPARTDEKGGQAAAPAEAAGEKKAEAAPEKAPVAEKSVPAVPVKAPVPAESAKPADAQQKTEPVAAKPVVPPAPEESAITMLYKLLGVDPAQGQPLETDGYLGKLPKPIEGVGHILYRKNAAGQVAPFAFLTAGKGVGLDQYNERTVSARGTLHKVPNWNLPLLKVDSISAGK